uniref:NADH dehydrogenase subunit 11 n=1 Tax=Lithodesmium undulatum TaxID=59812 RepID=A0A7T6UZQ1_LITUN|nr:NADH dehydrogenase subunit 11 [Lithodesmium undulatum]QQJ94663.1 NADH dehydrogenase subunit 11 [Lithodesmium undulatum]
MNPQSSTWQVDALTKLSYIFFTKFYFIDFYLKYFYINNIKFNYDIEFNNNSWKHNTPLIEYCESIGINIPHYCYHKNLSISGNCRMCLIEVKNSPKPVVSCAMSAKSCLNNNSIFTQSPLVKKARENILEFLLLNHPLDCPICDQGGECDLQDQSFFFGITKKRFYSFKRFVIDKNIGPIVKTVMTRCIHCTRCVRFADEVAGIGSLGMFGRGLHSEIGTYINKIFKSELSGNVVDLCPVGALTTKPYPFIGRSWELKSINSIDFADGFGTDIQVFLKNNKVVKILPNFNYEQFETNWISDKTRFSFDGMFSPERIVKGGFLIQNKIQKLKFFKWKTLFCKIINILYFNDHLNRHLYITKNLTIIFNSNISLEVLNLLTILSQKYSFIQIKKIEFNSNINDFDSNFILNNFHTNNFDNSNLCLLINVNSRFEGTNLNLKLRQRFLKGNFKIVLVGSLVKLTFPVEYLGSNLEVLKDITEGNHAFCQQLTSSINPIIIYGSEVLKRKDSTEIINLLNCLKGLYSKNMLINNEINLLNSSINDVGVTNLNFFKQFSNTDFSNSMGLYFINTPFIDYNLKKIIELKSLQILNNFEESLNLIIEHNYGIIGNINKLFFNKFDSLNYFNLPNKTFYESSGTYLTTTGHYKTSVNFIPISGNVKEDWNILRKLFSCTKSINFTQCLKQTKNLSFNCINLLNFKNFVNFKNYPVKTLTKSSFYLNKQITPILVISKNNFNSKSKIKIFKTKLKFWLEDFYISGKDLYSFKSSTMIKCSKVTRLELSNFNIIS